MMKTLKVCTTFSVDDEKGLIFVFVEGFEVMFLLIQSWRICEVYLEDYLFISFSCNNSNLHPFPILIPIPGWN